MTLVDWLEQSKTSQSDLARKLGVSRAAVHAWARGKVSPTVFYALAIDAVSGGAVELRSWLDPRDQLAIEGLRKKVDSVPSHG